MGFAQQEKWNGLPFSSPVDHIFSELFTITHLSFLALYGMDHSFTELYKPLRHEKAVNQKKRKKKEKAVNHERLKKSTVFYLFTFPFMF